MSEQSHQAGYCLACGYSLYGLSKWRCPECGQRFHPHYSVTFATAPPRTLWRRVARTGSSSFAFASAFMLANFFLSALVPEPFHGVQLLTCGAALLVLLGAIAYRTDSLLTIVVSACGFAWGFLVTVSVAISIANARVSVNWPNMLLALVFLPVMGSLVVLPVWVVKRRLLARRREAVLARSEDA